MNKIGAVVLDNRFMRCNSENNLVVIVVGIVDGGDLHVSSFSAIKNDN